MTSKPQGRWAVVAAILLLCAGAVTAVTIEPASAADDKAAQENDGSSGLMQEVNLLQKSLIRLNRRDDAVGALMLLDEYERRFPVGVMAAEAVLTRVQTLLVLGRKDEAIVVLVQKVAAEARAATFRGLVAKLRSMIDAGTIKVTIRNGRMLITLPNDVLFDSGKKKIKSVLDVYLSARDIRFSPAWDRSQSTLHKHGSERRGRSRSRHWWPVPLCGRTPLSVHRRL